MSDQEADLNDIYEELIKLKDILDKIEDTCQNIIDYDLNKKPSISSNDHDLPCATRAFEYL